MAVRKLVSKASFMAGLTAVSDLRAIEHLVVGFQTPGIMFC